MGLRFFENLLMSYYNVITIHDRLALFLKCLFLIVKYNMYKKIALMTSYSILSRGPSFGMQMSLPL